MNEIFMQFKRIVSGGGEFKSLRWFKGLIVWKYFPKSKNEKENESDY